MWLIGLDLYIYVLIIIGVRLESIPIFENYFMVAIIWIRTLLAPWVALEPDKFTPKATIRPKPWQLGANTWRLTRQRMPII